MYDELYAAGLDQIVGAVPYYAAGAQQIVGQVPYYAAGYQPRPQYAMNPYYAAGLAAAGGAPPNAPPAGNQIAYGSAIGVQQKEPSKPRLYPIGFVQLAVPALNTVTVTSRPQTLYRPQRLVVPAAIGTNFVITDIRIGKDSQLVQATELPAAMFSEVAVGVMMTLDTAQIANDISLVVRNTDAGAPHDFRAAMFGASVD